MSYTIKLKIMKKIINSFLHLVIGIFAKKRGKCRVIDCSCGKTYEVCTNIYDNSDSGCGSCECGICRTYIN